MKLAFKFENGTSQMILTPENARDKSCLDLCMNERPEISLKPTNEDCIILEFGTMNSKYKTKVEEPQLNRIYLDVPRIPDESAEI